MTEDGHKHHAGWTAPFRWIAGELSRLRLTVWLLIVMGVTMIVGSIFPQGYDADTYISSWGEARYALLSKLGFLNLFHTKYFLILGSILLLNLVFCSLVRWSARRGAGLAGERPPAHAREIVIGAREGTSPIGIARDVLTARGYKILSATGNVITARRGPWPEGVSLLYHLAIAVAILGFILSALYSFEGDVTLYPAEPVTVRTVSAATGANRILGAFADTSDWAERNVTLTMSEFITEWELHQEKYYPKDWITVADVTHETPREDVTYRDRRIEVNRPFRIGALTFYQMAYEQEFDVVVSAEGVEIERVRGNAYEPFTLESIGGTFFPGTLRVGTLFEKYHEPRPVVPHVALKWQPPAAEADAPDTTDAAAEAAHGDGAAEEDAEHVVAADTADTTGGAAEAEPPAPPPEKIEIGDLSAGEPLEFEGHTLTLENPYEGSVLTYRHDPGVTTLYIAIVAFLIGLALRTYWPSYRVNIWIDESARGRLAFRATGMLGDPEAKEQELVRALSGESD